MFSNEGKDNDMAPRERGSSPEANTTDSGYISPPELHTDHEIPKESAKPNDDNHDENTKEESETHTVNNDDTNNKPDTNDSTKDNNKNSPRVPTTDLDDDVDEKYFNSFLYWRNPLPQVDLGDFKMEDSSGKTLYNPASELDDEEKTPVTAACSDKKEEEKVDRMRHNSDSDSDEELDHPLFSLTDDLHDDFEYDDFRKVKLKHSTSSFEEELLLGDPLAPPPKQVML